MKRSTGSFLGLLLVSLLFIARPGCNGNSPVAVRDVYPPNVGAPTQPTNAPVQQAGTSTAPSTVIIGSFNIQTFGPSKASKPRAMQILADIARSFDLLAIQELRNEDQSVIEEFINLINSDGSRYSYIVGPRQGYTYSKEQYAYLYDTAKFRLTSNPYVAPNPNDAIHRPPLIANFECAQAPAGQGFTFTVMNLHVDPDVVDREFRALEVLVPAIVANHADEDDFIVMGDFNDSEKRIQQYRWLSNQLPLVRSNWSTKVRSGRSIDNLVINGLNTAEYRNQSGVLNVRHQYQLSENETLQVSDHFPVWAVFSTVEVQNRLVGNEKRQPLNRR